MIIYESKGRIAHRPPGFWFWVHIKYNGSIIKYNSSMVNCYNFTFKDKSLLLIEKSVSIINFVQENCYVLRVKKDNKSKIFILKPEQIYNTTYKTFI